MTFTSDGPNYRSAELETPYWKAQQVWDERLGSSYAQLRQWRWLSLALLVVCGLLAASLAIVAAQQKNTVYVAEIGQQGRVINVAPLSLPYNPDQAQVEYFLGQFVQLVRALPLDPVVAKQNWLKAYAFLSPRGTAVFNQLMRNDNPLQALGKQTVTVQISAMNALSNTSYDIDWSETVVGANGQTLSKTNYAGVFTVSVTTPKTQAQILTNPLGIMIDNVHWSRQT